VGSTATGQSSRRIDALRDTIGELLGMDEPRRRFAGMMSGLDIHYDLGDGHPLGHRPRARRRADDLVRTACRIAHVTRRVIQSRSEKRADRRVLAVIAFLEAAGRQPTG
jgi:hypothetical protein